MDGRGSTEGTQWRTKARTVRGPATKGRRPGADRLSALSDELLIHILSFLGIREAVSTSRLSRRWPYLFHNLSSLDFSSEVWDTYNAWFIDRVLLFHAAPRIEVFRLSMRVEVGDSSAFRQIDSLLLFAVRRGARVLDLDIDVVPDSDDRSYGVRRVPPWLFHCRTLVTSNPTIPQHSPPRRPSLLFPWPWAMDGRGSTEGTQRRTAPGPAMRDRRPGADRLSDLSDELLLHILSFLGIREAVSTSRLSRRWRYLFHNLSSLDFSKGFDYDSSWPIDRVLLLHAAPRIEVFRLSMHAGMNDQFAFRQIDSRLLFAVRRGVRVLDLHIDVGGFFRDESYNVPPWVFHCRTLEDLSVDKCYLCLPAHVHLVSLKKMRLRLTEFEDNELECLLRGCPLLQRLELVRCNSFEGDLIIDTREGRNLEELVIVDGIYKGLPEYHASKMQIYAPSVKYLRFRGIAFRGKYEVMDLSSLVVASFQLNVDGGRVLYEDEADVFTTGLLLRIPQVQVLKLCRWSLQALSKRVLRGNLVSALSNVTRLELTIGLEEPQLQAILSALHACSNLRTLVLSILQHMKTLDSSASDETEIPQSFAHDSDIVMQDLKKIVIQGLTRYYNQNPAGKGGEVEEDFVAKKEGNCMVFIGFLLRVSPVLEELIVQPSAGMKKMTRKWELLFNLYSDLLSLPRASPYAKVIIDGK